MTIRRNIPGADKYQEYAIEGGGRGDAKCFAAGGIFHLSQPSGIANNMKTHGRRDIVGRVSVISGGPPGRDHPRDSTVFCLGMDVEGDRYLFRLDREQTEDLHRTLGLNLFGTEVG